MSRNMLLAGVILCRLFQMLVEISFDFSTAGGSGEAINIMLKSPDSDALDAFASDLKAGVCDL